MPKDGTHHGTQPRDTRSRDGESWDPEGGAGVVPANHTGYSGSDGKNLDIPKSSSGGGGGAMNRADNEAYKE